MGYQINSPWTELRRKDIEKLNKIIDDRYCNELEIGRKLHIMEVFEKKLNEAINDFNFDNVINFMKMTNWKWSMYKNGKSYEAIPNRNEIIDVIKVDFFKHGLYNIIELGHKEHVSSTGGLVFEMGMTADYPSNDNCYLNIYFDIAHFVKD